MGLELPVCSDAIMYKNIRINLPIEKKWKFFGFFVLKRKTSTEKPACFLFSDRASLCAQSQVVLQYKHVYIKVFLLLLKGQ
jgi:hypothetical protein